MRLFQTIPIDICRCQTAWHGQVYENPPLPGQGHPVGIVSTHSNSKYTGAVQHESGCYALQECLFSQLGKAYLDMLHDVKGAAQHGGVGAQRLDRGNRHRRCLQGGQDSMFAFHCMR